MNVLPGDKARLTITVIEADLIRDVDTFSTMDPYSTVTLNTITNETRTCQKGGKHPEWNESFDYEPKNSGDVVDVKIMDR